MNAFRFWWEQIAGVIRGDPDRVAQGSTDTEGEVVTVNRERLIGLVVWAAGEKAKAALGLPSEWYQGYWFTRRADLSCGTACCMAGKVVLDDGGEPASYWAPWSDGVDGEEASQAVMPDGREVSVSAYAQRALGLDDAQADLLFEGGNSLSDILTVARDLLEA